MVHSPRSTPSSLRVASLAAALLTAGCPSFRTGYADVPTSEVATDATTDVAADAGSDVGVDLGVDLGLDARPDAPPADSPDVVDAPSIDAPSVDAPAVDVAVDRAAPVDSSVPTPRPIGPPVGAVVTWPRPSLNWRLPGALVGAAVQVCRDRACTMVESSFDAVGASATVTTDLPTGAHFWRLRGITSSGHLDSWSSTWEFWISPLRPPREGVYGTVLDFDGDGVADLAIGAPGSTPGGGRVFVWRGPLPSAAMPLALSAANESTVGFGHVVASVGDVDGDGITDLGVSSYDPAETQGVVEVFHGNAAFALVRGAYLTTPGERTFGFSLDGAGDTNGDGYADVLVGQPGASDDRGRAYVHLGSAAGLGRTASLTLRGRDLVGARFGYALAGGADFDNDRFADIVVGGPGAPVANGGAYAYVGSSSGISVASMNILGGDGDPVGRYGAVVAHVGDVNDDGFSDIAVASPGDGTHGGRVLLYVGSGVGLSPSPVMLSAPSIPTEFFGAAVAGLGDLDGDGIGDLGIGAPSAGFGGRMTVAHGARMLTPSVRRTLVSGLVPGGGFGSVIGSFDLVGGSFVVGAPLEPGAPLYVPSGAMVPSSPTFNFTLAGGTRFGTSVAGIW